MKIEIKEKGTKEFYKETVNVLSQYQQLLYKPDDKLKDNFKKNIFLTVAMGLIFIINLIGGINQGFRVMTVLILVFSGLALAATAIYIVKMYKMVNAYLADDHPSVVTIDEEGIEIEKTGSQAVRLAWDNVAFVRSFAESTCFFSKDHSGIVLSVTNDYKKELLDYIKENNIDVKIVKVV